jgi:hypothetical protein
MALKDLFHEIETALGTYKDESYQRYVRDQSSRYVTEMFYTEQWTKGVVVENFKKMLRADGIGITAVELKRIELQASQATRGYNTPAVWKDALEKHGFVVSPNDVLITTKGSTVCLNFNKSFTMGEGREGTREDGKKFVDPDRHYKAQKMVIDEIAKQTAIGLENDKLFVAENQNRLATSGGDSFGTIDKDSDSFKKRSRRSTRLHTGDFKAGGRNDRTYKRNDSTVKMVHFLEKMRNKDFQSMFEYGGSRGGVNYEPTAVNTIAKIVNEEFNAAYSLEGFSEIDLFSDNFAEKDLKIKIVFGLGSDNKLANAADSGKYEKNDPRLDGFFAALEDKLLTKFSKDLEKTASLSMGEMIDRGVFAKIPSTIKTASGMPDMRFKINKNLVKEAKYKDKEKTRARTKQISKAKSKVKAKFGGAVRKKAAKKARQASLQTNNNPLALEALLNELLPKVVASKMTSPALNFRTGRFAASAEAKDVMVGPRGGLNVNYTYMRDPYETFEPGNAMGSTQRDPRKIIGESVREIAQSIIGDRFLRIRRV